MGCQSSKLDHQKEEMLPKLPPLLSRKLEEIKRRRAAGATLSKKQLLKHSYEDDSTSAHTNDCKSNLSPPEPDDDSIGSAQVAPEPTEPIFSDNKVIIAEEKRTEKDNKDNENAEDHKPDKEEKVEAVVTTMEKLALEETKDEKNVVEEYGRFNNVELPLCLTCPGSPSFRFYLTENEKEDDHRKDDYMIKGSLSDTDVDAAEIVESRTSTEELGSKIKKRGRRGMRFRRVIPMGKPVKNFLKVKSCYYPSCGGHEISRRLITQKSATM